MQMQQAKGATMQGQTINFRQGPAQAGTGKGEGGLMRDDQTLRQTNFAAQGDANAIRHGISAGQNADCLAF